MGLIELLVGIVIVVLLLGLIYWGMGYLNVPQPAKSIIILVIALVVLLLILNNPSLLDMPF